MNPTTFRYELRETLPYSTVKLVSGSTSATAKIASHPLFAHVKEIHLKDDDLNKKCLQLVQNGSIAIPHLQSKEFLKRCKEIIGAEAELDAKGIGLELLQNKNNEGVKVLDFLSLDDCLKVIKEIFDKTPNKLHGRIGRKLKGYAKNTQRQQPEKKYLETIIAMYKEGESESDKDEGESEEIQQQRVPRTRKPKVKEIEEYQPSQRTQKYTKKPIKKQSKKQQNEENEELIDRQKNKNKKRYHKGGFKNNYLPKKQFNKSKDGQGRQAFYNKENICKADPKIMLGIHGDTQEGWRQRNRPRRVPPSPNQPPTQPKDAKKEICSTANPQTLPSSISHKKPSDSPKQLPKKQSREEPSNSPSCSSLSTTTTTIAEVKKLQDPLITDNKIMKLIFTFPKDGKKFDFSKLNGQFVLLINHSVYVRYNNDKLSIIKNQNGYIRTTKIDILEDGFTGEGLTVCLNGSSNIEDGGDILGFPIIQDFTGSGSQFFHVTHMQIYVPE